MKISLKKKLILAATLFLCFVLIPLLSVRREIHGASQEDVFKDKIFNTSGKGSYFCVLDESCGEILNIPDREFLYGAVTAEMPARFESEALKAQAVASYTYFCKSRNDFEKSSDKDRKYAFTVNTEKWINYVPQSQMRKKWGSEFDKYYDKVRNAVDSVFGEVVEDDGNLILAAYHAISSGKTEKSADVFGGDLKYLTNVESPGDKLASGYETKVEVFAEKFKEIVSKKWNDCDFESEAQNWIKDIVRTDGGMVKEINIASHKAKGTEIREMFGLRSSDFTVKYDDENKKFIFDVFGYGHGVGMSQCGAQYMAKKGADYKKILEWYYPNTTVAHLKR